MTEQEFFTIITKGRYIKNKKFVFCQKHDILSYGARRVINISDHKIDQIQKIFYSHGRFKSFADFVYNNTLYSFAITFGQNFYKKFTLFNNVFIYDGSFFIISNEQIHRMRNGLWKIL